MFTLSDSMSDDIVIPSDMVNIFWATTTPEVLLSLLIAADTLMILNYNISRPYLIIISIDCYKQFHLMQSVLFRRILIYLFSQFQCIWVWILSLSQQQIPCCHLVDCYIIKVVVLVVATLQFSKICHIKDIACLPFLPVLFQG